MALAHYLCLKRLTKLRKFLVLNLGSKKYFSVKEIVKIICKKIKSKKLKFYILKN